MRTLLFEKYIETSIMTMRELAEVLGYTPEYLSLVRHGHFPLTGSFIARACLRLGEPINALFLSDVPEDSGTLQGGGSDNIQKEDS